MYVTPDWYKLPSSSVVAKVKCFVNDFQEPYVLLRRAPETPMFDERFVNYGYNKVQLFEHLRAANYQFYILSNAFAMDIPHPDSTFRKNYLSALKTETETMRETYNTFQNELNTLYANQKHTPICQKLYTSFYIPL